MRTQNLWHRARDVFDRVVATQAAQRAEVLARECAGDAGLRIEVEMLLDHHVRAGDGFLNAGGPKLRLATEPQMGLADWAERLTGRKIGRFTLVRMIASGGMGCVFEARQDHPRRAVALKILRPGLGAPSALARFRHEPELLARLQHPNIAQVFEAGVQQDEQGPLPYFAMELIEDARPITGYAAEKKLSVRERLALFVKVCDAVQHGHQKGIVHRDLKPGNILVCRAGEPKVIDFGVARATDADVLLTTQQTRVGDLIGTVRYMSPEQCDGDSARIDTRSDIYSLGFVLYELLTGVAPYDTSGTTIYAAVRVIKEETPRRPSESNWALRGNLDAILLKALEKEPGRRYASAGELAADIRRHLAGEPVEARTRGLATRVLRWAVRHPIWVTVAACGLLVVSTAAAIVASVWFATMRPNHMVIGPERDVAWLKSAAGIDVRSWRGNGKFAIQYAGMAKRAKEFGGGQVAIVGYNILRGSLPYSQFALYDLRNSAGAPPDAVLQLRDEDIPFDEIRRRRIGYPDFDFSPPQFLADVGLVADIFDDPTGVEADEFAAVFQHGNTTHSALCIYRLDGKLVYRVWLDVDIRELHWLSGPRQLVIAGANGAAWMSQREIGEQSERGHPCVVFALRIPPEPGFIKGDYVLQEENERRTASGPLVPAWYFCLGPPRQFRQLAEGDDKILTAVFEDPANAVHYNIYVSPDPKVETEIPIVPAGVSWIIRADGTLTRLEPGDGYRRFDGSTENSVVVFPPYASWTLGKLPAIREGAVEMP